MFEKTRPETTPVIVAVDPKVVSPKHVLRSAMRHGGLLVLVLLVLAASSNALAQEDTDANDAFDGEPVTLEELLAMADDNAPDVQLARERIGLGRAAAEGARMLQRHNPEIEGEVGVGLDDPGISRAEVTLRQRLEIAGQRGLRVKAARQRQRALDAELEQARWDVHQRVYRLYRKALIDREQLEVERDSLDFTQRLHRIAKQRFETGETARTSVIIAHAEVARAKQRRVQAKMAYEQTARELAAVVGWDREAPPIPRGEPDAARPAPDQAELLDSVRANDPRLAVLRARLEQARAQLSVEQRDVWPDPTVGVGYEQGNMGTSAVSSQLRFIVGIPLPLWNRNQGGIDLAKARTGVFSQAISNRTQILENRVAQRAAAVDASYRQAEIYQDEVLPALETQLELLQEGFKLGEMSLLDVMNARDRLLAVQRQHLTALHEYFAAISQLEELLGTAIWNEDDNQ
ncbi:MAG: TolC family protein [Myxococcota bacterium]